MDGAHVREFEAHQRRLESAQARHILLRAGRGARVLELGTQAELHLPGRLVGEGHGDRAVESSAARAHHREDAGDQLRGLARARGRLDHQRSVEVFPDGAARLGICEGNAHGSSRSTRSCRSVPGLS